MNYLAGFYPALLSTAAYSSIACTLLINTIFFQWISVENTSILSYLPIYFFVCNSSNVFGNFIVLWGVLKKSWQERYIQLAFMRVCRYLRQRVRKIGEYSGRSFKGFSEKKYSLRDWNSQLNSILGFYYCLLVAEKYLEKCLLNNVDIP